MELIKNLPEMDEGDDARRMDAYKRVAASRAKGRPTGMDFIENLIIDFMEFHGDRRYGDDPALVAGVGKLKNMPVTVIAMEKGHSTKEKVKRNFGSMHPEGYRKALRQMKLAEKFGRPVICIVDTSGAYCGIQAEERGQGQAIAENLMEMMTLRTPIITLFIGEGGSGGALGMAVADQVWMLENSFYSVISPEGCASILWKDASKMKEAAESLRLTARDLKELGVAEKVIREPEMEKDFKKVYYLLEDLLYDAFQKSKKLPVEELLEQRYEKFRKIGRQQADGR
ncbi:acetyl-CoA carboxylase carboxyltransferase subunit alpha [Bacilliculturomica massiliensis]|uniref:acetyl-CoA carboxylase carboxyltransferase subunit alpha n=1 Tax=Bacilliculturomica massiliensis TaxID=1917867 RepID=UPI00102FEE50|nr:acetyl-CoA carboxylase carboxyltransferase subunit alpha [Bacilliculturomica massiliensis]